MEACYLLPVTILSAVFVMVASHELCPASFRSFSSGCPHVVLGLFPFGALWGDVTIIVAILPRDVSNHFPFAMLHFFAEQFHVRFFEQLPSADHDMILPFKS